MDADRNVGVDYELLTSILQSKYHKDSIDIVYATDDFALAYLYKYRDRIINSDTYIVSSGINNHALLNKSTYPNVSGVYQELSATETISFARTCFPNARTLTIISDYSRLGKGIGDDLYNQAIILDGIKIIRNPTGDWKETQAFVESQSRDTLIILGLVMLDNDESYIYPDAVVKELSDKAKGPLFVLASYYTNVDAAFGGKVYNGIDHGHGAAGVALRVIAGDKPSEIPALITIPNRWVFNDSQLKRFKIDRSLLPEGSIVQFKPENVITSNPRTSTVIIITIVLLVLIICYLIFSIRQRLVIEKLLKNSREELRILIDESPLAIAITDNEDGRIVMLNRMFTEITGYSTLDVNDVDTMRRMIIPDAEYRKQIWDMVSEEIKYRRSLGKRIRPITYRIKTKSGNERELEMNVGIASNMTFRIFKDVTMQHNVMRELEASRTSALAANVAKSRFLANVSHEIRTPMNGIIGMTQLFRDTRLTATQKEYIDTINESCDLLLTVINDLLDFSKIEAGHFSFDRVPIALRPFLTTLTNIARPIIERKGLEFKYVIPDSLPDYISCDPNRLKQILLNLLVNASKFTDKGYVKLNVSSVGKQGTLGIIHFDVEDTGIGIAQDQRARIFEPYMQTSDKTMRRSGGTGLGLSICRKFVEMLGGQITIKSEVDKGSTFSFDIQAHILSDVQIQDTAPLVIDVTLGKECPLRILVVEDNKVNQKVIRLMLTKLGYDPIICNDGEIAVKLASEHILDVILMDIQMPNMDGYEATKRVRASVKYSPYIVALTAHTSSGIISECANAGMDGYLSKPIQISALSAKLSEAYKLLKAQEKTDLPNS